MIAYAIIGMPVNIILFTYLGDYFGRGVGFCQSNKRPKKNTQIKLHLIRFDFSLLRFIENTKHIK